MCDGALVLRLIDEMRGNLQLEMNNLRPVLAEDYIARAESLLAMMTGVVDSFNSNMAVLYDTLERRIEDAIANRLANTEAELEETIEEELEEAETESEEPDEGEGEAEPIIADLPKELAAAKDTGPERTPLFDRPLFSGRRR